VNSKETESLAEMSCNFSFLMDSIKGSEDIERVQVIKLLLRTASGFFFRVFFSRSNLFIVVARISGSLPLFK